MAFLFHRKKMTANEMIILLSSLSYMVQSGINIRTAVDMVHKDPSNRINPNGLKTLKDGLDSGDSLFQVFKDNEDVFGTGIWEQIEVAQRTGRVPQALLRIANQIKANRGVVSKIRGALIYPVMVLTLAAVAGWYLLTHSVPEMAEMMADLGGEMPEITLKMMSLCNFMIDAGWMLVVALVIIGLIVRWLLKNPLKVKWHRFISRAPLSGSISTNTNYARAYMMINDMIANGSEAMVSLRVAASTVDNKFISGELLEAARIMEREGYGLARALQDVSSMPPDDRMMLGVGQQTGREMEILQDMAERRIAAADESVARLLEMMNPIIMVFVCIIVGILVVAIYMPMLTMASSLQ